MMVSTDQVKMKAKEVDMEVVVKEVIPAAVEDKEDTLVVVEDNKEATLEVVEDKEDTLAVAEDKEVTLEEVEDKEDTQVVVAVVDEVILLSFIQLLEDYKYVFI